MSHPTIPLLVTAHETGDMLLIDERMSKFVGRIQAHSGAVTTVGMHSSGLTLASGGCDGFVRCWDIRQRKLLYENKVGLEIRVSGLGFGILCGNMVRLGVQICVQKYKSPLNPKSPNLKTLSPDPKSRHAPVTRAETRGGVHECRFSQGEKPPAVGWGGCPRSRGEGRRLGRARALSR